MRDLNDKVTGGSLTADEWNDIPTEMQNIIEDMSITLSGADLDQLGKALASMIGASTFYFDGGIADAYVMGMIGAKQGPTILAAITEGLIVRFRPGNTNTGASTVNVNGLGAKTITREDATALSAGDLDTGRDAYLRYDSGTDTFLLLNSSLPTDATPVAPKSYLAGMQLANGTDAIKDINIAVGLARDSTDTKTMRQTISPLVKQIDANWAEGTAAGGFPSTLTLATDQWYDVFAIRRTSDGNIDAGYDTSPVAANLLIDATAYSEFRRLGSVLTDGTPNIIAFTQAGDFFLWTTPVLDINTNLSTAHTSHVLTVPTGVRVEALAQGLIDSGSALFVHVRAVDHADQAPSASAAPSATFASGAGGSNRSAGQARILTDTSAQVRAVGSAASVPFRLSTLGWVDRRGRDD